MKRPRQNIQTAGEIPAATPPAHWGERLLIVLVGLVPLLGVLWLNWSAWTVMLLFWIENVLLGGITLLRILLAMPADRAVWLGKLFLLPFFVVHYGFFCAGHLVFVVLLFGEHGMRGVQSPWDHLTNVPEFLQRDPTLVWASCVIAGVLLVRMLIDYVLSGAYRTAGPQAEMMRPYSRIVVLHLALIFGGFLVMTLGAPTLGVVVLILLKLGWELGLWHWGEARSKPPAPPTGRPAN